MTAATTLARSDFLRAPLHAAARPRAYKEWQHFVVHQAGFHLVVNFSLMTEQFASRPNGLVPRVVVVAHDERWTGAIERFEPQEMAIGADLRSLVIARSQLSVDQNGYRVTVDLPQRGIQGDLHLTPASRPFVVNNQPLGAGRLSWLFVPRLRADGWFQIADRIYRLENECAYHDHNWGRFQWGDDFGWQWASILPSSQDDPWSFVFMRMTDRRGRIALSQALYVWHGDEAAAMFRDAALRVRSTGLLARPPDCTLPGSMRLVLAGNASDIPAAVEITAARAGNAVHAVLNPATYARVAQPSEVDLEGAVALTETSGWARITGCVNGKDIDFRGPGVFEFLNG